MGADLNYDRGVADAASHISEMLDDDGLTPQETDPAPPKARDDRGRFAQSRAAARARAFELGKGQPDAASEESAEGEDPDAEPQAGAEESPDAEPEEGDEAAEAPDGEEGDPEELTFLADVAKQFGLEEGDFLKSVQIDADGKKIPLAQVVEEWKSRAAPGDDPAVRQRSQELEHRELQLREREDIGLNQLRTLTEQLIASIETEDPIDWKALRESGDTVAYLEAKEKAERKRAAIEGALGRMRHVDLQRQQQQVEANQRLAREQASWARSAVPEWADRGKAEAAMAQVRSWLQSNGPGRPFAPDEIEMILDGRYVIAAWKASEYDRLTAKKPAALKKLKGLPKPLRPGVQVERARQGGDPKEVTALRRRLRQSGSVQDAARLISRMEI